MQQRFFSAIHSDINVRRSSSSGGAFTAITDAWLSEYKDKAVIYGCILDNNTMTAKHIRVTDAKGRDSLRGSKYIASDMSDVFSQVADDLRLGNHVIFTATPCGIAALKIYLDKQGVDDLSDLLLIDFVCHGVGDTHFFQEYIAHLERKYKSKAVRCSFRGKSAPHKISDMLVEFENGKRYSSSATKLDWFYSLYYGNYILRPSCFTCKYTSLQRVSDITLGDCWGQLTADYSATSSLIIASSSRGYEWIKLSLQNMSYIELTEDTVVQAHLQSPADKPADYDEFWQIFRSEGYLSAQKFAGNNTFSAKLKSMMADFLDKTKLLSLLKKLSRKQK